MDNPTSAELGNLLTEYRGSLRSLIAGIILTGIFALLGFFIASTGAMAVSQGDNSRGGLIVFGVLFAVLGLIFMIGPIINRLHIARVYERGMIDKRLTGEKTIRWDEVKQVTFKPRNVGAGAAAYFVFGIFGYILAGGAGQPLVLTLKNGKKIKFQQTFGKINDMAREVANLAADALLPEARNTLESGGSLSYGNFVVNKQGLSQRMRTITWMEIGRTMVNGRKMELYDPVSNKMITSIDLTAYPNGALMKKLIEEYSAKHSV